MKKATLKDLYKEVWLRMRNNGEIKWITKSGKAISIKDMSDEHLVNTINMIEKQRRAEEAYYDALGSCNVNDFFD